MPSIYLLVFFHVYTLQIPKFWNTDGHIQQFYGNCQTPKWKTGLRFFYFLGKSCSFFRFFFLCVIFQWAPILKLFILKSFITEAVIIQKPVWYLYDNGPCHERVRPIASFKSNKSNNTFFVIKHLWFWFISYVESVTSNSEIGHSRLSKQSPYKNRGPVRPCPFLRIWEVQPHPPHLPPLSERGRSILWGTIKL